MDAESACAFVADNVVFHDPLTDSRDTSGFMANYRQFFDRVTNLKISPYAVIGEGNFVAVPYLWQGTKPATEPRAADEPLSGNAVEFFRIADGKIVEIWRQYEQHDFSILGTAEDYRGMGSMMMTDTTAKDMPQFSTETANANRRVVLGWIDSYNNGKLDTSLMASSFLYHTCPCSDVGTINLQTFAQNFREMTDNGTLKTITPISHNLGLLMVSEGDLTAMLYDTHETAMSSHADRAAIFRLEDGKIAEEWQF
jgi:predicted SnoaL-like aldol condensation-catalyzing enzyme